jgi:hypothetical protein
MFFDRSQVEFRKRLLDTDVEILLFDAANCKQSMDFTG